MFLVIGQGAYQAEHIEGHLHFEEGYDEWDNCRPR